MHHNVSVTFLGFCFFEGTLFSLEILWCQLWHYEFFRDLQGNLEAWFFYPCCLSCMCLKVPWVPNRQTPALYHLGTMQEAARQNDYYRRIWNRFWFMCPAYNLHIKFSLIQFLFIAEVMQVSLVKPILMPPHPCSIYCFNTMSEWALILLPGSLHLERLRGANQKG